VRDTDAPGSTALSGTRAASFATLSAADDLLATRAVYDASAPAYAEAVGTEVTSAFESVIDRAFLTAFAERLEGRAVADVGCGPGRVASFLATRCPDVVGIDLAPAMVQIARTAHPHLRFEQGRLDDLPFPDASLEGVVCWYSVIHTAPEELDAAFAELARVVAPRGCSSWGSSRATGCRCTGRTRTAQATP
jgi:ubiquinone/menaquinone biosynthesis C-methylase UbiE